MHMAQKNRMRNSAPFRVLTGDGSSDRDRYSRASKKKLERCAALLAFQSDSESACSNCSTPGPLPKAAKPPATSRRQLNRGPGTSSFLYTPLMRTQGSVRDKRTS